MYELRRAEPLRCYVNWLALDELPEPPGGFLRAIQGAGYDGIQLVDTTPEGVGIEARSLGLDVCGSGRVNRPEDADAIARKARNEALECVTLHVGWGLEDDLEMDRLIAAVLNAEAKYGLPLYPETHRATIFQDMWRTVRAIDRFPQLRFNCDFSHWYTGQEMVYGGFERKLTFIRPVIERGRFVHGRIGDPGSMQVQISDGHGEEPPHLGHFRALWTAVFASFLEQAEAGENICFATELLGPRFFYARRFDGVEESDRWQQSLLLRRLARECFADAERSIKAVRQAEGAKKA